MWVLRWMFACLIALGTFIVGWWVAEALFGLERVVAVAAAAVVVTIAVMPLTSWANQVFQKDSSDPPRPGPEPTPVPAPGPRRRVQPPSRERLERLLRSFASGLGLQLASQVKPAELASARSRLPLQSGEEILAMKRSVVSRPYLKVAWEAFSGAEPPSDVVALTTHGLRTALAKPTADNQPVCVSYLDLPDVRFEAVSKSARQLNYGGGGAYWTTTEVTLGYVVGDGIHSYLAGVGHRRLGNWRDFVAELTSG